MSYQTVTSIQNQPGDHKFPLSRFWERLSLKRRDELLGYAFVTPQFLGFLLFVLGPIVAIFVFSTQNRNLLSGMATPIGLGNYQRMFQADPFFPVVMGNSLLFSMGLVPLNLVLALTLAILLTNKLRGMIFFRTLFFAPVITSAVAWAIVWRFLLQGDQGINSFLEMFGIQGPNWLREPGWAMASVIVTRVLKSVGLNMVILMAALQNIPQDFDDAAAVDGANLWQRVTKITLPLLSPTIMLILVLTIIGSLQVFDHIMLMTGGGPANATNVLVYYIYFQAFKAFQTGYASALATVLFVLALAVTIIQWQLRRRFVYNER